MKIFTTICLLLSFILISCSTRKDSDSHVEYVSSESGESSDKPLTKAESTIKAINKSEMKN